MNALYFIYLQLVVRQLSRTLFRSSELEAIVLGVCEGVFLTVSAREESKWHGKSSSSSYLPILLTLSAALDAFFFARLESTFAHVLGGVLGVLLAEYGPSVWDVQLEWESNEERYAARSRSASRRRHDTREHTRSSHYAAGEASTSRGRSTSHRAANADRHSRALTTTTAAYTSTPIVPLHPPRDTSSRNRADPYPNLTIDTNAARARQATTTERVTSTRTARFSLASPQSQVPTRRTSITAISIPSPRSHASTNVRSPVIESPSTPSAWSQTWTAATPVSRPQQKPSQQQRQEQQVQQQRHRSSAASSRPSPSIAKSPSEPHRGRQSYVEDGSDGERTPRASTRSISASRRSPSRRPVRIEVKPPVSSDDVWVKVETPVIPVAPRLSPSASGSAVSPTNSNSGDKSPKERLSRIANRISGIFDQDIGDVSFFPTSPDKGKTPVSPGGSVHSRAPSVASNAGPRISRAPSQSTTHIAPSSMAVNNFFVPPSPARIRLNSPTRSRPASAARSRPASQASQDRSRPVSQAPSRPVTPSQSHPVSPSPNFFAGGSRPGSVNITDRPPSRSSWVLPDFGEQTQFNIVETSYKPGQSPLQSPRSPQVGLSEPGLSTPTGPPVATNTPAPAEDILSASEVTGEESVITILASREGALNRARELRKQADQAMSKKGKLEQERVNAYKARQYGKAFALKFQRDEAEAEAERLNRRAARRFQQANNTRSRFDDSSTLDVHGLKKKEAIICVERKLRELQLAGKQRLKVIVGKGKHSKQGIAVLKPAVLQSMQKQGLQATVDMKNKGVVYINIFN